MSNGTSANAPYADTKSNKIDAKSCSLKSSYAGIELKTSILFAP